MNSPGVDFLRKISKFEKSKRDSSSYAHVIEKNVKLGNFRRSRAATGKKCTRKRDVRAKLLFCQCKPIAFLPFSLTSPSSLLKLLIISNETGTRSSKWRISRWTIGSWACSAHQLLWSCSVHKTCHDSITNFSSWATSLDSSSHNVSRQSIVPEVWWWTKKMDRNHRWSCETRKFWWEVCKYPRGTILWVRQDGRELNSWKTLLLDNNDLNQVGVQRF